MDLIDQIRRRFCLWREMQKKLGLSLILKLLWWFGAFSDNVAVKIKIKIDCVHKKKSRSARNIPKLHFVDSGFWTKIFFFNVCHRRRNPRISFPSVYSRKIEKQHAWCRMTASSELHRLLLCVNYATSLCEGTRKHQQKIVFPLEAFIIYGLPQLVGRVKPSNSVSRSISHTRNNLVWIIEWVEGIDTSGSSVLVGVNFFTAQAAHTVAAANASPWFTRLTINFNYLSFFFFHLLSK